MPLDMDSKCVNMLKELKILPVIPKLELAIVSKI